MGPRLQARAEDAEARALFRLTASYLAVFTAVIAAISFVAYAFVASTYRSIVAPALDTPEGRAGFAAAMRPALYAILSVDGALLLLIGVASYVLARAALRPLVLAREREHRFASEVAHELRTPLAAIASVAEAAAAGARAEAGSGPAAHSEAVHAAFASIARRAIECGELVGDLLTLARASDVDALDREPLDLAIITQHVLREFEERRAAGVAGGAPIAVDGRFESAIVTGDERRLRQLLRNVFDNAFAHARSRVAVTVTCEPGGARLSVEDDGPGVAPEVSPHLFERFAKARDSKGSGLGLAICRWVAHAHGGTIEFAGGSRFLVTLPLA
jgi:two-component system OmpR family sensor kinase